MSEQNNKQQEEDTQRKCEIISEAPEVVSCVKLLCALFKDTQLKNFVYYDYEIDGEMYQLVFRKLPLSPPPVQEVKEGKDFVEVILILSEELKDRNENIVECQKMASRSKGKTKERYLDCVIRYNKQAEELKYAISILSSRLPASTQVKDGFEFVIESMLPDEGQELLEFGEGRKSATIEILEMYRKFVPASKEKKEQADCPICEGMGYVTNEMEDEPCFNCRQTGKLTVSSLPEKKPLEEIKYCQFCGKQSCIAEECIDN